MLLFWDHKICYYLPDLSLTLNLLNIELKIQDVSDYCFVLYVVHYNTWRSNMLYRDRQSGVMTIKIFVMLEKQKRHQATVLLLAELYIRYYLLLLYLEVTSE